MNHRDLELLSSYLDGQLSPSDVTRLEARLKTDPQLASVLNDLRGARTLLRKLPARKAPRNFTLTRKMVGLNPPLPRSYPFFRFASALATLLFIFSFGFNSVVRLASQVPLLGMGGGGGSDTTEQEVQSFAAEAPAAEMASTEAPVEAAATEDPSLAMGSAPVQSETEVADAARMNETPVSKAGDVANADVQNQASVESEATSPALVPSTWQTLFAIIAILSVGLMFIMRQLAMSRWK